MADPALAPRLHPRPEDNALFLQARCPCQPAVCASKFINMRATERRRIGNGKMSKEAALFKMTQLCASLKLPWMCLLCAQTVNIMCLMAIEITMGQQGLLEGIAAVEARAYRVLADMGATPLTKVLL